MSKKKTTTTATTTPTVTTAPTVSTTTPTVATTVTTKPTVTTQPTTEVTTTPTTQATTAPTTSVTTTPTVTTTPVTYNDGSTYDSSTLNNLTNQISTLTGVLGTDKYWTGGALNAGQGANIGFDSNTGAQILGTNNLTNKQQVVLDMAAFLNKYKINNIGQIGKGNLIGDVNVKAEYDQDGNQTGSFSKWDGIKNDWVPMTPAEIANIRTATVGFVVIVGCTVVVG